MKGIIEGGARAIIAAPKNTSSSLEQNRMVFSMQGLEACSNTEVFFVDACKPAKYWQIGHLPLSGSNDPSNKYF